MLVYLIYLSSAIKRPVKKETAEERRERMLVKKLQEKFQRPTPQEGWTSVDDGTPFGKQKLFDPRGFSYTIKTTSCKL